jgi:hypothetical protein
MKKKLSLQFFLHLVGFLLIIPPTICSGVEGFDFDFPYPITPPKELFGEIKGFHYIPSDTRVTTPLFHLLSEANEHFFYNFDLTCGFHHLHSQYKIKAKRKELLLIENSEVGTLGASFNREDDSLSLHYKNTSWYDLSKEITSFATHFTAEMVGYCGEVSSQYTYFESKTDYHLSISYHKNYGYSNMLSTEFRYIHSPFLQERDKILQISIKDRFSFKDYLFLIPGIKAEFISQTLFTPFLESIYLLNKYVSIHTSVHAKSYESTVNGPFSLPHITFPESLTTPTNVFRTSFILNTFLDSTFSMTFGTHIQKVDNPIISKQNQRYALSLENSDTTIIFSDTHLSLEISKRLFSVHPQLTIHTTPFYDQKLPYSPRYCFHSTITLRPITHISFTGNLQYTGTMYDSEGNEIKQWVSISPFLYFNVSKNVSFHIGALNILDQREKFIHNVFFPGRIYKSGVNIIF